MKVKMLTTAANAEMVLQAGKCYDIPKQLAQHFMGLCREESSGGKTVRIATPACELAPAGAKITRIPATPDPEDVKADVIDDEDDVDEADDE